MTRARGGLDLLFWTAALSIAAAILYPIGCLAWRAFHPSGAGWSLEAWRSLARSPFLGISVRNTLLISSVSAALSVAAAAGLALLSARADFPGRRLLWAAALSPFLLSQSVTAIAWVVLAERHGGLLNVLLGRAGLPWSAEVQSAGGIVFVTTLLTLPVSFLILEALTRNLNAELEEAALVCGARPAQALGRVALPLLWPGIAAAGLLCFMLANVMFSVQGILGLPRSVWTVANLIYFALGTYPSDLDTAAALALGLLAVGLLLLWLQARLVSGADFHVISGRRRGPPLWRLPGWARAACAAVVGTLFLVTTALPYGALLWRSLAPENVQVQGTWASWTAGWSLDGYRALLADASMRRGLLHSFVLASAAALSCVGLASLLAYRAARARGRLARALPALCVAPFAFSGMVLGLGFIVAFSGPPLRLYGSLWLLWLAYTVRELAVAYKAAEASLAQLAPELEEAAFLCGAGPFVTARRVFAPLLAPALTASGLLVFLASYREIEVSVLLAGPGHEVFGYQLFNGFQDGTWRQISALALVGAFVCAAVAGSTAAVLANRRTT